ncbi:MAG: transposase [Moorea sp. SIO1F2]|nr:transposase [Moorena sp. SIO1F2]
METNQSKTAASVKNQFRKRRKTLLRYYRFSISENYRKKGEVYGFDGGKKVKGRKRHILVDTQGLLLGVVVTEGNAPVHIGRYSLYFGKY